MLALEKRLADYLESITSSSIPFRQVPSEGRGLPLFLRERYRLRCLEIFGWKCLLALETPNCEPGTPAEYAAHVQAMQTLFSEPVTLVVPQVASYARNRMIKACTPFIVPGSQIFMPFMLVDLRERFLKPAKEAGQLLTPAAQCILLYHILRKPLQGMPLQDIAKLTGYSAMMVTKVKDEWEANGLCQTSRVGRSVAIEFAAGGRHLWHMAELHFTSPVKKSHWIDWQLPKSPGLVAGFTAMSNATMIADDAIPAWALHRHAFRTLLENGTFRAVGGPEVANVRVEEWSYDPTLLSDGPDVDPLSLYLSLREDRDDRVQLELQTMLDSTFSD